MGRKNTIEQWWDQHKKTVMIVGAIGVAVTGTILWIKVKDANKVHIASVAENNNRFTTSFEQSKVGTKATVRIVEVHEHLRLLPAGHHPSSEKLIEAAELGIKLERNQTLISAHQRKLCA